MEFSYKLKQIYDKIRGLDNPFILLDFSYFLQEPYIEIAQSSKPPVLAVFGGTYIEIKVSIFLENWQIGSIINVLKPRCIRYSGKLHDILENMINF